MERIFKTKAFRKPMVSPPYAYANMLLPEWVKQLQQQEKLQIAILLLDPVPQTWSHTPQYVKLAIRSGKQK